MHGYITVPRVICDAFVDTEVFQRLRNIEQTSMRWLFPGGRHDRFIHSLGVYHLARKIFTAILDNSNDAEIRDVLTTGGLREAFEIAALMHDCGHAPFSHTFEDLYNSYFDGSAHNDASDALLSVVDAETNFDLRKKGDSEKPPAPHEVMSAYVLISQFGQALKDNGVRSVSLVARMITGCARPQPQQIVDSAVLIEMEPGKIRSLTRVVTLPKYSMVDGSVENSAFYVFVKKDCASRREEMIEFVNRLSDMELSEQEVFIQELRSKNANPAKEIARV